MTFIPVPNTVELRLDWEQNGKEYHTVLNVTSPVAWTVLAANNMLTAIVDYAVGAGLGWMSDAFQLVNVHATDLSSASGFSVDNTLGTGTNHLPVTGSLSATLVSNQVTLVSTLRTASRGRSFRGRNYWPGMAVNQIYTDGESVLVGRVDGQQAYVVGLQDAIQAIAGLELVVVSRHADKAPRTSGITTPVIGIETNDHVDTQRRRVKP